MIGNLKKQSGSAHVIIISVLVVAIVGLLGFVFWQNFLNKSVVNDAASSEQQATADQSVTPSPEAEIKYKTFTSPLSGYTVEYPEDWKVSDDTGGIFTNNNGGKSYTLHIQNVTRTGSYDGHDANTYVCVDIVDYNGQWQDWSFNSNNHLTQLDQFQPRNGTTLGLYVDSQKVDPTISEATVYVTDASGAERNVQFGNGFKLNANVGYNCIQGDGAAIASSSEKFLDKPETATAVAILKSIRY